MGKKGKKTRWRRLPIGGEGGETGLTLDTSPPTSDQHRVTFNEDEYTKITTPRQDVLFKKGYFARRRAGTATDSQDVHSNDSVESESYVGEEVAYTCAYPAGYMDPSGVYYVNGNTFETYDPYTGTVTVVVGPPAQYPPGPPLLAALPCQPVPLQSVEWFNPASPWCYSYNRRKRYSTDSQNCSAQSSESPGSPQEPVEEAACALYPPQYVYPGYMFGPPIYNVNGMTVQGMIPQPVPTTSELSGSKRRKKRRRRRRGVTEDGSESSCGEEVDTADTSSDAVCQSGASSDAGSKGNSDSGIHTDPTPSPPLPRPQSDEDVRQVQHSLHKLECCLPLTTQDVVKVPECQMPLTCHEILQIQDPQILSTSQVMVQVDSCQQLVTSQEMVQVQESEMPLSNQEMFQVKEYQMPLSSQEIVQIQEWQMPLSSQEEVQVKECVMPISGQNIFQVKECQMPLSSQDCCQGYEIPLLSQEIVQIKECQMPLSSQKIEEVQECPMLLSSQEPVQDQECQTPSKETVDISEYQTLPRNEVILELDEWNVASVNQEEYASSSEITTPENCLSPNTCTDAHSQEKPLTPCATKDLLSNCIKGSKDDSSPEVFSSCHSAQDTISNSEDSHTKTCTSDNSPSKAQIPDNIINDLKVLLKEEINICDVRSDTPKVKESLNERPTLHDMNSETSCVESAQCKDVVQHTANATKEELKLTEESEGDVSAKSDLETCLRYAVARECDTPLPPPRRKRSMCRAAERLAARVVEDAIREGVEEASHKRLATQLSITEAVTRWLHSQGSSPLTCPASDSEEEEEEQEEVMTGQKNVRGNPFLVSSRSGAGQRVANSIGSSTSEWDFGRARDMCDPARSVDKYYRLGADTEEVLGDRKTPSVYKTAMHIHHNGPFPCGVCCIIQ